MDKDKDLIEAIKTLTESIDDLTESNRNLFGIQDSLNDRHLHLGDTLASLEKRIEELTKMINRKV